MNIGEVKKRARKYINEYSNNGNVIASTDGNQQDFLIRMNELIDDAQNEVSDNLPIRATEEIIQAYSSDTGFNIYDLPATLKEFRYITYTNDAVTDIEYTNYRILDNKLYLPKSADGTFKVFYYKNPDLIDADTLDTQELEVDQAGQKIIAYYVGGMVIADELPGISNKLLNIYYSRLEKLKPQIQNYPQQIISVYGM